VWIIGLDGVLPDRPSEHAWLIAETSNERGDYEENVRILDRMIATLEVDRPN
jgi:hypothetical protein